MTKKVLIADDEGGIREVDAKILAIEGFSPLSAETCEKAVRLARQELPDLIILDAQFLKSELQGVEACRILKGDERTMGIPIIGSSSPYAYDDLFEEAGAVDYLQKPYSQEQLMEKVRQYIGGK